MTGDPYHVIIELSNMEGERDYRLRSQGRVATSCPLLISGDIIPSSHTICQPIIALSLPPIARHSTFPLYPDTHRYQDNYASNNPLPYTWWLPHNRGRHRATTTTRPIRRTSETTHPRPLRVIRIPRHSLSFSAILCHPEGFGISDYRRRRARTSFTGTDNLYPRRGSEPRGRNNPRRLRAWENRWYSPSVNPLERRETLDVPSPIARQNCLNLS